MAKTWSSHGPSNWFFLNNNQCSQGWSMPNFTILGVSQSPLFLEMAKIWSSILVMQFQSPTKIGLLVIRGTRSWLKRTRLSLSPWLPDGEYIFTKLPNWSVLINWSLEVTIFDTTTFSIEVLQTTAFPGLLESFGSIFDIPLKSHPTATNCCSVVIQTSWRKINEGLKRLMRIWRPLRDYLQHFSSKNY